MKSIYLDNAATTPIMPEVWDTMEPYLKEFFGNPSSTHAFGRKTKSAIESARKIIAKQLNCKPAEIFFTSGGTEANNTILKNAVRDLSVERIITSKIEHHCVLHTVEYLEKQGVKVEYVALKNGHVDYAHLETLLEDTSKKTLVSLMHANNELGNTTDIKKVAALCTNYGALYHSDTVQTMAHYLLNVAETPIHFLSGAAHKFHGPKGVGFMYVSSKNHLQSFIHGGAQERGYRAGTENVAGIVGMARAFELAYQNLEKDTAYIQELKNYAIQKITQEIPEIEFNTDIENSLYTVLNISLPPQMSNDMTLFSLDLKGIACSGGSACSSGADKGSHVMEAINHLTDRQAIRFSFSKFNTKEEIDYLIEVLKEMK